MMQDTSFTLKLLLQPNLKDNKIRLDFENENILLENNNEKEIVFNLTFNKETKNIPLITFSQFKADPLPSIKIKKLFINGYEVRELYKFFSFDCCRFYLIFDKVNHSNRHLQFQQLPANHNLVDFLLYQKKLNKWQHFHQYRLP